jgi:hypothetical protein
MMDKKRMPHIIPVIGLLVLGFLGLACATARPAYKPLASTEVVIGTVQASYNALGTITSVMMDQQAYTRLLEAAKKSYQGNIDVRDVTWVPVKRIKRHEYEWLANGSVILLEGGGRNTTAGVEGALARAAEQTVKSVPVRSKIAIVYITALDRSTTDYIAGELEYIWVNEGYIITDRSQLDRLRREQNFQMSGEVDDETAVSIGKFAGANIIVTGRVDGEGSLQRLRLRALDTQTAQVVGVASERL